MSCIEGKGVLKILELFHNSMRGNCSSIIESLWFKNIMKVRETFRMTIRFTVIKRS